MNENEAVLLRRFTRTGDAEAFAEITRLYAGMVYGVCLRVTRDAEHARDATQDTFFQLLKSTGQIRGSLGGWLHQVATRRAVDLIRRDSARRQREQAFAADTLRETDVWSDVSPLVDEAMNEISAEQRDLLLRHFLQGETTIQLAATAGVSQPTMSRQVTAALDQLRQRLHGKGIGVSATTLAAMMGGAASTAPAAVMAELGKIALVSSGTAAGATATLAGMKTAAVIAVAVVGVGGWMFYQANRPMKPGTPAVETMSAAQPTEAPTSVPDKAPITVASAPGAPAAEPSAEGAALGGMAGAAGDFKERPPATSQRFGGVIATIDSNPVTPTGALNRFALALSMAAVRPERLRDCFEPGSRELKGFERIIQAPQTDDERAFQQCLLSLSVPVEVIETTPTDDGMRVKWRARVRNEFSLVEDGVEKQWKSGDRFELEIRLKQVGTEWKIAGF